MAILTSFPSCGFLSLLLVNQISEISVLDLLERNRQAKIYLAEKEFENYTDVDELRKAAVNRTVEAWICTENECNRADNELARRKEVEANLIKTNQEIGVLRFEKNDAYDKALQTFVVPYLCQKADTYLDLWGTVLSQTTTTTTSAPINPPYSPQMPPPGGHDLDSQTRSNYRNNAKKIYGILKNSNDPRVLAFVAKVKRIHPAFTEENIADNFGLAIALLNNCKHGVLANDPELSKLINPDTLVKALRKWSALKDGVLLDVVKCFEEVTS